MPKPLTAEQIKNFKEKRKKSDDRLKSGGAIEGKDGRFNLTDGQMDYMQSVNIGHQCSGEFNGIKMFITEFSPSEGQHCLNIGGYSVWDVGKNLEEVRDVFEFAKKLAEKGEDAKAVFEKTEEYVVEKEKKQEREMEEKELN